MNEETRRAIETVYQAAVTAWFLAKRHNDGKAVLAFDAAATAIRDAWPYEINSYLAQNGVVSYREEDAK